MSPPLDRLHTVVKRLGPLRDQFVLVGATVLEILLAEAKSQPVRITHDVDFIVRLQSRGDSEELEEQLRRLGFKNRRSGHIDSWEIDGCEVDIVDCNGSHGAMNRWYVEAMERSVWRDVGEGLEIRVITGPYFIATKIEAFQSRGKGSFYNSEDIQDILTLLDRCPAVVPEIAQQNQGLRSYIASKMAAFLAAPEFINALPGHVDQGRAPAVRALIQELTAR